LEVARALTDLADVCRSQGEYRQAESFYRRALTIEKKVLGPDHHHLAGPLNRLAAVLCDQRKWDEAESIYRQAITLSEKVLDPDFSYHALLESLNGCSFVLQMKPGLWGRKRKARLAESERMGAQAQAILEKISVKR
jgi:tetratricopeptide (TPR) repeat protein